MTVLLINPNRLKPAVGPLGLELVAEALEASGLNAVVLDLAWERAPLKAIKAAVKRHGPAAVGVSVRNLDDCYFASRAFLLPPVKRCVRAVREATDAPVILGGVGFSIAPSAVLEWTGADYGIRGDGERSFPELIKRLASGGPLDTIPGLVAPGQPEPAPAGDGLAKLPSPRRNTLDLAKYFNRGGQGNIETLRGCNRKCIYCADRVSKGTSIRRRDPGAVVEEMERLVRRGVNVFHLCDTEFNLSRAHAEAVCRAVLKAGLEREISWYTYALPRPMDCGLAKLMARAGCRGIDFGVDSADEGMLDAYGRDFSVTDLENCARACKSAGITFMYDLLLGGPGETRKSLARTIKRIKRISPDKVGVSFGMRVFPGTEMGRRVKRAGPLDRNPELHGVLKDNDSFIKPVFFVSESLGRDPEAYLKNLIGGGPAFLFASRRELGKNYNYNDNRVLVDAVRAGARGAYWAMLK